MLVWPRDAFLVLDRNGNHKIDTVKELFGNIDGYANGFDHLATLDNNKDGQIAAGDQQFKNL